MRNLHSTIHSTATQQRRMALLRGKLLEKRQLLLERMRAELSEPDEPAGVPGDPADMAHSTSARETSYEIGSVESNAVAQIDYALRRIESGKYGICEDCGDTIPEARLRAVPFAVLCVKCQQTDERTAAQSEAEAAVAAPDLDEFGEGETAESEVKHETIRGSRPA